MHCSYCYYIDKCRSSHDMLMDDRVLEKFIREYIEAQSTSEVLFTWHGGEPTLRGLEFYKRVVRLQQYYARQCNIHIDNVLQTNGTLLTEEWGRFLHDKGWLVGISIDGPRAIHDKYRQPASFDRVMHAIDILKRNNVMWNAMAVVTNESARNPEEVYSFFKSIEAHYIQFTPLVDNPRHLHNDELSVNGALSAEEWGHFLCGVFDAWVKEDVGEYFVEIFDATLANYVGVEPGICCFSPTCGKAGVIEHNGDVYSCDHFVEPEHLLGNIKRDSILDMMLGRRQQMFGESKRRTLSERCLSCPYLRLCNGECPKNRMPNGENILCAGYLQYFRHTAPFMLQKMSEILS